MVDDCLLSQNLVALKADVPNTSNSRVWNDHELKFAAQKVLDEQM